MPMIEVTDSQQSRLETLREEIEAEHAGSYTTVSLTNVLSYLLDLSDAVDDPTYAADRTSLEDSLAGRTPFPREQLEAELRDRKRKHSESTNAETPDLYTIASEYDITGRSRMTKDELIAAVLDEAERRYSTPFADTDPTLAEQVPTEIPPDETSAEPADNAPSEPTTENTSTETDATQTTRKDNNSTQADEDETDHATATGGPSSTNSGSEQLNTMLSLLQTHADKWSENSGDARYEVQLPDGSSETARTKDDVRALLFKNYR